MSTSKRKPTRDAVEILDRIFGGDEEWDRMVAEEAIKLGVAVIVYNLREEAGLTQAELAEKIGVTQAMISKLENADYDGGFLDMLLRVCLSLDKQLIVRCKRKSAGRAKPSARAA